MTPRELVSRWREDAERLGAYDERLAAVASRHADDLEAALRAEENAILDLSAASRESGLSVDRLRHKVAAGEIANAGKKGAPRIRRADLPVKHRRTQGPFDAASIARDVIGGAHV